MGLFNRPEPIDLSTMEQFVIQTKSSVNIEDGVEELNKFCKYNNCTPQQVSVASNIGIYQLVAVVKRN